MPNDDNELMRLGQEGDKALLACYEMAEVLCSAVLAIAVLFTFIARFAGVMGSSMVPTLHNSDWLAVTAYLSRPECGDIVIISPRTNRFHDPLVKRVIATGGQEVDILGGRVFVDGEALEEPYLPEGVATEPGPSYRGSLEYPLTVPAGRVFVLGDNRGGSSDSRVSDVGFVREDDILGRVVFRLNPFFSKDPKPHFTFKVE
jgi:signal peptidase I